MALVLLYTWPGKKKKKTQHETVFKFMYGKYNVKVARRVVFEV